MAFPERFDVVDWGDGSPTGATVERNAAHAEGIPHAAIHLWICACTDGAWSLLFQKRASHKETFPDLLDATVGGHLRAGETWRDGLRETEEEIGITVDPARCVLVMRRPFEVRVGRIWDREWLYEYCTRDDRELSAYSFPDGEATALVRVSFEDLSTLMLEPDAQIAADSWEGKKVSRVEIGRGAFNPNYFLGNFLERIMGATLTPRPPSPWPDAKGKGE
jgi:isopentenyldiphosphate isomerase